MKAEIFFEPHLVVNEISLPPSAEWMPKFRGWSFIQVRSGISYWQQPTGTLEISPGSALVLTREFRGSLRASQLGEVSISYFCMEPEKLTGLLSLSEQNSLKKAAAKEHLSVRVLPPTDPIAERFRGIGPAQNGAHLSLRLQLLQLFVGLFKCELDEKPVESAAEWDGRGRLRQFLKQTAESEFLNLSLAELAPRMHCSPRHLSRLFRQEVGATFRDKQTGMRLAKACQLLASSNAKVIDVALASGYQSNSLFSLMFKKHFGVSPGKWRQRHGKQKPQRQKVLRTLPV
jgi:AraC-like DNA-binding protein